LAQADVDLDTVMGEIAGDGGDDASLSLEEIIDGKGIPFEVGGRRFYIRHPSTEEHDQAILIEQMTRRKLLASPELQELKDVPISDEERAIYERMIERAEEEFEACPDDARKQALVDRIAYLRRMLESRSLADEIAEEHAVRVRDRWLTFRLVCDEDGNPMFDPRNPEDVERWDRMGVPFKEAARRAVWAMLQVMQTLPFGLETPLE